MASTADTLTANGAPVTLAPPTPITSGSNTTPFTQAAFAVMGTNSDEIAVASYANDSSGSTTAQVSGYSTDGALLFRSTLIATGHDSALQLATAGGGGVMAVWAANQGTPHVMGTAIFADGSFGRQGQLDFQSTSSNPRVFSAPSGTHVETVTTHSYANSYPDGPYVEQLDLNGAGGQTSLNDTPGTGEVAYAHTLVGGADLVILDNQAYLTGSSAVTVPREPVHAMTEASAVALTDGHTAAVAWADSGTGYVSIFNASTDSFGAQLFLDWGATKDLHTVALADGGFAVSWSNNGQYKGELFTADGTGGGVLSLTGQFAALNSHGDLYTVGLNSAGAYAVQTYTVNGPGSGGGTGGTGGNGSSVATSDANYTAPDGVTAITLTGSNQTIHANNGGDTINSDNTVNQLYGGTGNDTFHLGRGGDVVAGGGGADTFAFAENPWNGGHITDFSTDDSLDLSGMLSTFGYTGSDPIGAGYLKIVNDANGNAQVWSDTDGPGSGSGWWLVTTLDGVSASQLQLSNGVISEQNHSASTADANYTAPDGVTSITLTGSNQTIHANNAGDAIISDNTANHLYGGTGADTFHLGRGGDIAAGGGGADTFAYAENPWNGGHITDFSGGDRIDLTGMLSTFGYSGSDPVGAGYLKIVNDANGNAQIWSDTDGPGSGSGWWLVTTVDGVGAFDLQLQDGVVTHTSGPSQDGTISTAAPNYQAPAGVTTIILTGSAQTVTGNNAGDTFVSNNTGNHLTGGSGNDTFELGRGGDIVTSGAGTDTYIYQETPWAAGQITDFSVAQGDRIDLNGLLAHAGYSSGDPIAEGYLKILDTSGGAQIWADPDGPGSASGWWLVDTLIAPGGLGLSAGTIKLSDGLVTGGGNGAVVVEDTNYTASRTAVTSITLAGSARQQIWGNDLGDTFHDNNNANYFSGGSGNDTFILGLGGSTVLTGAGADTVVMTGLPTSHENIMTYTPGSDRIDLRGLLSSIGSTGSDPFNDGHLRFVTMSDSTGHYTELQANDPVHSMWTDVLQIYNTNVTDFHYANGWLT